MEKRGQLTVFVIIGIIIIGGIIVVLFLNSSPKTPVSLGFEQQQMKGFLTECFYYVYTDSLDRVGNQGGYYREPLSEYLDTGDYNMPFYYYGEITYIPTKELIEEELSYSVDSGIFSCLNRIPDYNLEYDYNYRSTNVTIDDKKVTFVTDLDLVLKKGNQSVKINFRDSPTPINSKLLEMNNLASYITYSYSTDPGSLCVNCILSVASDKGFNVEIYNDFKNLLMVNIFDNSTDNHPQDYSFFMTNLPGELNLPMIPGNNSNSSKINMSNGDLNAIAPKI